MGLGHMRRNLLLAQTLRHSRLQAVVLMIAGAREASLVTTTAGVDCVALPSRWRPSRATAVPRNPRRRESSRGPLRAPPPSSARRTAAAHAAGAAPATECGAYGQ